MLVQGPNSGRVIEEDHVAADYGACSDHTTIDDKVGRKKIVLHLIKALLSKVKRRSVVYI